MNPAKPLRPLLSRIARHLLPRVAQCLLPRLAALTLLLVTVFLSAGCESVRLRRDIQRIMESRIVLPHYVSVAFGGDVYPMPDSVRHKPKMIVYADERNSFLKDNPTIPPSDSRLHSLFVDGEGKPVLVGDPALNGRIREIFEDKLKEDKLNLINP